MSSMHGELGLAKRKGGGGEHMINHVKQCPVQSEHK
jgi:hypothetical protein